MKFGKAQYFRDVLNKKLKRLGFKSFVVIETKKPGNHYLVVKRYGNEILPKALNGIKQIFQENSVGANEYVNNTPNTPSGAGKWIDKPLSPGNRKFDGPGATGYIRSRPELQDIVHNFASIVSRENVKNNEEKMDVTQIANKLRRLAAVERNDEIDKLLKEMSRAMNIGDQVGSRVSSLFDRFSDTYDVSLLPKLKEQLKKGGYKSRDKIVRLVDQLVSLMEKVNINQEVTGKEAERVKLVEETRDFLTSLSKTLPDIARNLNNFDLIDEAERINAFRADLSDINKAIARLAN